MVPGTDPWGVCAVYMPLGVGAWGACVGYSTPEAEPGGGCSMTVVGRTPAVPDMGMSPPEDEGGAAGMRMKAHRKNRSVQQNNNINQWMSVLNIEAVGVGADN